MNLSKIQFLESYLIAQSLNINSKLPNAYIDIEEGFGLGIRCIMRWKYSWTDMEGKKGYVSAGWICSS